ncbi:hypothetical protein [Vibrio sp. TBV020]|uniref:hypothetical protein n=1 Tax=Vibrio sp. TBV020 TaxID=3137398 RepID=UPI0038CDC645
MEIQPTKTNHPIVDTQHVIQSVSNDKSKSETHAVKLHNAPLPTREDLQPPKLDLPHTPMSNDAVHELNHLIETESVAVDLGQLMKLLHQFALTQYEFSKEARHAERDAIQASFEGQADKIREQASKERLSGLMSASFSLISGTLEVAGSIKGFHTLKESKQIEMKVNDSQDSVTQNLLMNQLQRNSSKLQTLNNATNGTSHLMTAIGQFASTQLNYQAKQALADGKLLEADQKLHESAMDDERARVDFYRDMLRDCKDKLEKILTAAIQTSKNITRA